ncbi:MAG: polyprenyl synthetase family protein, partial [Cellulomonadaceae bacterium]
EILTQARPWPDDPAVMEDRARAVLRAKSARYSVEHPVSLGATLAGADEEALRRCRAFGLPLGEAFQLRDDVLGVFGDPAETGKPAGDDLREGKRTVLLAQAVRRGSAADRRTLHELVGSPGLAPEDVARLRDMIVRTGALAEVETLIAELTRQAEDTLADMLLEPAGADMLRRLGAAAVHRST